MRELLYREARLDDVQGMAEVRLGDWETAEFWRDRIAQYLSGEHSPGQALKPRIAYVALEGDHGVGLIAGHLTRRHGCKGELQWISVKPEYRRQGVASELLRRLAAWFVEHHALRVCIDVQPSNENARRFYARHGATDLKPSWMVWDPMSDCPTNGQT